jgi:hypothetical protein
MRRLTAVGVHPSFALPFAHENYPHRITVAKTKDAFISMANISVSSCCIGCIVLLRVNVTGELLRKKCDGDIAAYIFGHPNNSCASCVTSLLN